MSAPVRPRRRLHNRLMLAFAVFTLLVAGLFGLYAMVFMYSVEDSFFDAMLAQEAQRQRHAHALDGRWIEPAQPFMRLYDDPEKFPSEWRATYRTEPQRHEFPGAEGRHYHLRQVRPDDGTAPVWLVAEVSHQLVVRPMRGQLLMLLAVSGAVTVVLAILLAWWLARRTAAPLSRLAAEVDAMTPTRLPPRLSGEFGHDEVGTLALGLNALIARIRAFVEREQSFTRDASHELRTPLAVIRSAAERLAENTALPAQDQRFLAHIQQSVMQLEQTVTLLLALAREDHAVATRGDTERLATEQRVCVLPVLERVIVDRYAALERDAEVPLDLDVPADAALAMPAPVLVIVLSNLFGNALGHGDGGVVRVDWRDGHLRLANFAMDAILMPETDVLDVFSKRENSPGHGLGLAIVGRLCARYGLALRIEQDRHRFVVTVGPA